MKQSKLAISAAELAEASDSLAAACFNLNEAMGIMASSALGLSRVTDKMVQDRLSSSVFEARRLGFMVGQ